MWLKNKKKIIKNNNMRCLRPMWKKIFIMLIYANMIRLWCKIVQKIDVEQIEGNDGSHSYLYLLGTSLKEASKEVSICA
jgi:hypothetical protein